MNKIYATQFVLDFNVGVKQLKKGKATRDNGGACL